MFTIATAKDQIAQNNICGSWKQNRITKGFHPFQWSPQAEDGDEFPSVGDCSVGLASVIMHLDVKCT